MSEPMSAGPTVLGLHGDAVPFAHAVPEGTSAAAAMAAAAKALVARLVSKAAAAAPRGATGKGKAAAVAGEAQPWESKGKGKDTETPLLSIRGMETGEGWTVDDASSSSPLTQDSDVHYVGAAPRQRSLAAKANATAVKVNSGCRGLGCNG